MPGQPWWQQTWVSIAAPLVALGGIAALANAVADDGSGGLATTDTEITVGTEPAVSVVESSLPAVTEPSTSIPGVLPATTIAVTVPSVIETTLPATTTVETTTTVAETTTMPPPTTGGVGSTLTVTSFQTTVDLTLLEVVDPAPSGGDELATPFEGNRWVGVKFMIVNTGTGVFDDLPSGIADIVDSAGATWTQAEMGGTRAGPAMDYVRLKPGDSRVGWMTFELPQASSPSTLHIQLDATATWNLGTGSPGAAPAPTFSAGDAGLNTPVVVTTDETELQVAVLRVVDPISGDDTPASGSHFVAVELELTNVGGTLYDDGPEDGAFLIDASGYEYPPAYDVLTSSGSPFPFPLDLDASETTRGLVVFEVLDGAQPVRFQFSPNSGFGENWLDFRLV